MPLILLATRGNKAMMGGGRPDYPYGYDEADGWAQSIDWLEEDGQSGRAVWTPEMRANYRFQATQMTPPELCPAALFYDRLADVIEQASSQGAPLAVVVLQLQEPPAEVQRQQALEMAVRLDVRKGDVPTRLGETTFAVLLPDTDRTAVIVAARLQRALANITGPPVAMGVASYPEDATAASELMQIASSRSA
jgi:hypothetical protein